MIHRWGYLCWRNLRVRQFRAGAAHCREVQHEVLFAKIRRHADSDFGREHRFSDIRSLSDFRRQVPLTTYEYYRPYVERLKKGDLRAMLGSGTRLFMFALTSGTTGDSKFIPVTRDFFDEYREGWNLWGVRTYIDHWDLCRKKTLQFSSDWQQFTTEGGTPCGNISGLAAETAPRISRPIFLLPRYLMKIKDPEARRYTALRLALASRRVGMMITANPSTLVELARLADQRRESLIRDLFDGTLSSDVDLPRSVRDPLRRSLARRHRERARELDAIVQRTGRLLPRDFWPDMSVLGVWTGGSVGAYLTRLKEFYGDPAIRDHGLSASEGRMTIPFRDGTSAGMLDYTHSFFEFVPENEHGRSHPNVLEAHELCEGENYYIVLTTSSGFYRYDIHDLVRCVGFEGSVPVLEFLNKGSRFSNVTGEKLSEFQVVSAVQRGFRQLGLPVELFTLAPVFGDPPNYVLLVEGQLNRDQKRTMACQVDAELQRMNCEYAERIQSGRLGSLRVRLVPSGTWEALRRQRTARMGASLEQYKHPCLLGDLTFVEQLTRGTAAAEPARPCGHTISHEKPAATPPVFHFGNPLAADTQQHASPWQ